MTAERRGVLVRRVRMLVGFTIAYNVVEAIVSLLAGSMANSSALIGFGVDSVIEVSSAAAVAWQFAGTDHEARERVALRIIGASFLGLAAFVSFDAISSLITGQAAEHSTLGLVIAVASLLVMPVVSWLQRRTGEQLGSASVVADSKQLLLCTLMSAVLLVGLVANSALGWWWADPIAAVGIAVLAFREGWEAWRGDTCCSSAEVLFVDPDELDECSCGPSCTTC